MPARQPSRQLGTLFVLLAAVLFGTTGTVLAHAPHGASALSVGAVRLAVGGPLLLLAAGRAGGSVAELGRHRLSTLAGGLGVVAFQLLYFVSTTTTGVALGTVVTIGSGPVFSGLIHWVGTRHPPSFTWCAGTAIGVIGVCLLALTGDRAEVAPVGVFAALGAGLGWASFATIGKVQIDNGTESTVSLGGMFTAAAVFASPLLVAEPMGWVASGRGSLVAIYLGVGTLTVAYALYGRALRVLAAPTVITLTLLEPVTAAVLAAAVLHETVAVAGWLGIALVLAGLVLTAREATVGDHDADTSGPARQHASDPATHLA